MVKEKRRNKLSNNALRTTLNTIIKHYANKGINPYTRKRRKKCAIWLPRDSKYWKPKRKYTKRKTKKKSTKKRTKKSYGPPGVTTRSRA